MQSINRILRQITPFVPTDVNGWHRAFSLFTIVMMVVSFVYFLNMPDFPQRTTESCYKYDAMVVAIKCNGDFATVFWNLFHPIFSFYYVLFLSYLTPLALFVYFSGLRGIVIVVSFLVQGILRKKRND